MPDFDPFIQNTAAFLASNGFSTVTKSRVRKPVVPVPDTPIIAKKGFLFGADPEFFIFGPTGKPVPPDMIPGSKAKPHKVPGGAVQRDGMAAEINIDPVSTFEDFHNNLETVKRELKRFLPVGHTLKAVPSVVFDKEVFDAASSEAKELGCQPDFNAWDGDVNPPPKDLENPYLRCAGGHLHIGWTSEADLADLQHILNCRDLVKQLDWYLGGWAVLLDKDKTRRRLYGKAGACRFKDYGVEYRVLSNFWLNSKEKQLAVWNRMQQAINTMAGQYLPDRVPTKFSDELRKSIDESEIRAEFLSTFKFPLQTLEQGHSQF